MTITTDAITIDALTKLLDEIDATPYQRDQAAMLYTVCGSEIAFDFCESLKALKLMPEYRPVAFVMDAAELPF